jgi:hypothetical protein
MADISDPA